MLTHDEDKYKNWQYWFHGATGWALVGVYPTRKEAQAVAGQPQGESELEPGTYVLARWDEKGRWMRVRCTSTRITEAITEIFTGLGCETRVEEVAAA